jgi:lysophospholipase L1-like esterase
MHQVIEIIYNFVGGAQPLLLTTSPIGDVVSGDLENATRRISDVASQYRVPARNLNVSIADINNIIDIRTDLEPDQIHLNFKGREKVANAVFKNLKEKNPHD